MLVCVCFFGCVYRKSLFQLIATWWKINGSCLFSRLHPAAARWAGNISDLDRSLAAIVGLCDLA